MHQKLLLAALLGSTMLVATSSQAASHAAPGGMAMKPMSKEMMADKDGMVTKDEFMKKMGAMWDKMDKDKKGKVPMADFDRLFNMSMTGG
ncbi:MAG: hypothetical protein ABI854_00155 [Betaproteobacteria bacterium]